MDVLCVSGNKHVVGIEIPVLNARVREAGDQLSGASQGLSACVPAVASTPRAVASEQHIREGAGVRHELGDQVGR